MLPMEPSAALKFAADAAAEGRVEFSYHASFEAIDRQRVDALRDDQVRDDARAVVPLLDNLGCPRRRDDVAVATAPKDLLNVAAAHKATRDVLEDLRSPARSQRVELVVAALRAAPLVRWHFVLSSRSRREGRLLISDRVSWGQTNEPPRRTCESS